MKKKNSEKNNYVKSKIKNCSENEKVPGKVQILKKNFEIPNIKELSNNNNKSKMILLFNDDEKLNDFQINKDSRKKKFKKEIQNNFPHNTKIKPKDGELLTHLNFNSFYYFFYCGKGRIKDPNIEIFNFGINFYRNQMSIINIFNIVFLGQIMIANFMNKKNKSFNQIFEIPIRP